MALSRVLAALSVLLATVATADAQGFGPPAGGAMPFAPPNGPVQMAPPNGAMSMAPSNGAGPMAPPNGAISMAPQGPSTPFGAPPPQQFGFPGSGQQAAPPPQPERQNYAEELTDFGVPPQAEMQRNVASPTPTTIPGAHVITTAEMRQAAGSNILFIDVLAGPPHPSLPGALMMPGAGDGGTFEDGIQQKLWGALSQATQMNPDRPIVFLCAGSRCWESYNAALRAVHMGFKTVLWYRGGLAAWQAAGLPMTGPGGRGAPPPQGRPGFGPQGANPG